MNKPVSVRAAGRWSVLIEGDRGGSGELRSFLGKILQLLSWALPIVKEAVELCWECCRRPVYATE